MSDPLVTPTPTLTEPVRRIDRRQWLLAGIIAILGGYLTILAIGGSLIQQLTGFGGGPAELTLLFVSQLVFAVAVTVLGYFLAPGSLGMRLLASAIYVLAVVTLVVLLTLRVSGGLGRVLGGPVIGATLTNSFFMILLLGALAWLIATAARPIAFIALVLAAAIAPVGVLLALAGVSAALSSMVQLIAVGIAAVVILLVSIPRRAVAEEPIDTADLPA
jgi:hypothetical protein